MRNTQLTWRCDGQGHGMAVRQFEAAHSVRGNALHGLEKADQASKIERGVVPDVLSKYALKGLSMAR